MSGGGDDAAEDGAAAWQAALRAARAAEDSGAEWAEVETAYLAAHRLMPARAEPLYRIGLHYMALRDYGRAHFFLALAHGLSKPGPGAAFADAGLHDVYLPLEYAVACFYVGEHAEAIAVNTALLEGEGLKEELAVQILRNRRYSLDAVAGAARVEAGGRRLKVIGPFRGASGYDRHTREFVRAFVRQGVEIELRHLDGWSPPLPDDAREGWFERLDRPVGAERVLHFTMPTHFAPDPGRRNINYTMFEADRIPASWAAAAEGADLIVLTTQASRAAWEASGVPAEKLRVSPLGVDGRAFAAPAAPLPLFGGDRPVAAFAARFLHIAELRARKNHVGLIQAWMLGTSAGDDAVLILKADPTPASWAALHADIADLERRLGRALGDAAPVLFLAEALGEEQVRGLYAAATHYISMSRGEGWDLPMIEAGAAGLTLVAPRHTAYPTYLDEEAAHWIPAAAVPARIEGRVGAEDSVFFDGLHWWEPDIAAAAAHIRAIVAGTAPSRRLPQARILAEFSWDAAARSLLDIVFA